ncbi:MAG: hypothetical protein HQL50_16295, partial [Magnetococcales bacterium]|nr:hypothetical protein [Magnetococcales bacterium]
MPTVSTGILSLITAIMAGEGADRAGWFSWRKEVVWFGNKKGDYIHSHVTVERV